MANEFQNLSFGCLSLHRNGVRYVLRAHWIASPVRAYRHMDGLNSNCSAGCLAKEIVAVAASDGQKQEFATAETETLAAGLF